MTLNFKKVFLFNEKANEVLGDPAAVELLFDEDTRTIGVIPKDPRNLSSFPLKRYTKHAGKYKYRTIHAAAFCKHFDISPRGTILFTNVDLDNEGTMLLELTTAVNVGKGFR